MAPGLPLLLVSHEQSIDTFLLDISTSDLLLAVRDFNLPLLQSPLFDMSAIFPDTLPVASYIQFAPASVPQPVLEAVSDATTSSTSPSRKSKRSSDEDSDSSSTPSMADDDSAAAKRERVARNGRNHRLKRKQAAEENEALKCEVAELRAALDRANLDLAHSRCMIARYSTKY